MGWPYSVDNKLQLRNSWGLEKCPVWKISLSLTMMSTYSQILETMHLLNKALLFHMPPMMGQLDPIVITNRFMPLFPKLVTSKNHIKRYLGSYQISPKISICYNTSGAGTSIVHDLVFCIIHILNSANSFTQYYFLKVKGGILTKQNELLRKFFRTLFFFKKIMEIMFNKVSYT